MSFVLNIFQFVYARMDARPSMHARKICFFSSVEQLWIRCKRWPAPLHNLLHITCVRRTMLHKVASGDQFCSL